MAFLCAVHCCPVRAALLQSLLRPPLDPGRRHQLGVAVRDRHILSAAIERRLQPGARATGSRALRGTRKLLASVLAAWSPGISLYPVAIHRPRSSPCGSRSAADVRVCLDRILFAQHEIFLYLLRPWLASRPTDAARPDLGACARRDDDLRGLPDLFGGLSAAERSLDRAHSDLCRTVPAATLSDCGRRRFLGRIAIRPGGVFAASPRRPPRWTDGEFKRRTRAPFSVRRHSTCAAFRASPRLSEAHGLSDAARAAAWRRRHGNPGGSCRSI